MRLDPAMVGRPRTTCKPSAHHRRQKPTADAPRGRCPDRLTPLRLKRLNGRVVRTHYNKRMGFATPRHRPTLGESRGAAGVVRVCNWNAQASHMALQPFARDGVLGISPSMTDRT